MRKIDDTTLLAQKYEHPKQLLLKVKAKSAKARLQLNIGKTKVMTTEELNNC